MASFLGSGRPCLLTRATLSSSITNKTSTSLSYLQRRLSNLSLEHRANINVPSSIPARGFHSTPTLLKFMRLIDVNLADLNKGKRNKRDLAEEIEKAPLMIDPDQIMDDAEYHASRKKARLERKNRSKDTEHPYSAYNFTITVIGRPNVGKSTLFNRLIGRQAAIVDGSSGVTRDWHDDRGQLGGLEFRVIDTAGLEEVDWSVLGSDFDKGERFLSKQHRNNGQDIHTPFGQALKPEKRSGKGIAPAMRRQHKAVSNRDAKNMASNYALGRPLTPDLQQNILDLTRKAVESSDLVLFMVDVRAGLTPLDEHFARWLRKLLTPKAPTLEEESDLQFNYTARNVLRSTHTKPVILLANKYDYGSAGDHTEENMLDFYNLGFGAPVPFSSAHGTGVGELFGALVSSMTDVLKQWDQYQQRVKQLHRDLVMQQKRAAQRAITGGEDAQAVLGEADAKKPYSIVEDVPVRRSLRAASTKGRRSTVVPQKAVPLEEEVESKPGEPRVTEEDADKKIVKVVVAGKPNVGKSTLINALIGENRMLTGPQPGVTRDSIAVRWRHENQPDHVFELVDTAGVKGITALAHSKYDRVDSIAMNNTVRSIGKANVVVLVIDVVDGLYGTTGVDPVFAGQIHKNFVAAMNRGPSASRDRMMKGRQQLGKRSENYEAQKLMTRRNPDKQAYQDKISMLVSRVAGAVSKHDMDVARLAAEHGKALIVLANKVDLLKGGEAEIKSVLKGLETLFSFSLAQNKGVTVLPVSGLMGKNLDSLPSKIVKVYEKWNTRINTGLLNRWLRALTVLRPPPSMGGKQVNLKYVTQTNVRPPAFAVFASRKTDFPEEYVNFLTNSLREEFNYHGVPLRVHIRTGDNPYVENRVLSRSERRNIARRNLRQRIMDKKARRNKKLPSNRLR